MKTELEKFLDTPDLQPHNRREAKMLRLLRQANDEIGLLGSQVSHERNARRQLQAIIQDWARLQSRIRQVTTVEM